MKLPKGTPGKTWGAKFSPALVWFHHPPPPGVPDTRSRNGELLANEALEVVLTQFSWGSLGDFRDVWLCGFVF